MRVTPFFLIKIKQRRLEIMKDSRTGAFGVISVIVLLGTRFLFIYEIVGRLNEWSYFLIILMPFLSKCVMGYLLCQMPLAKKEGLGAFFQSAARKNSLHIYWIYILLCVALAFGLGIKLGILFVIMLAATALFFLFLKRKIVAWFGGVTGDVLGASVEGVELWLWFILWLLHYFVMG